MLPLILAVSATVAPLKYPLPACSVKAAEVARTKQDLPPSVRLAVADFADSKEAFNKTDALPPNMEGLPFKRLICGYPTATGYVVEWEQGGRGYSIRRTAFRKASAGYELDPAPGRHL